MSASTASTVWHSVSVRLNAYNTSRRFPLSNRARKSGLVNASQTNLSIRFVGIIVGIAITALVAVVGWTAGDAGSVGHTFCDGDADCIYSFGEFTCFSSPCVGITAFGLAFYLLGKLRKR